MIFFGCNVLYLIIEVKVSACNDYDLSIMKKYTTRINKIQKYQKTFHFYFKRFFVWCLKWI